MVANRPEVFQITAQYERNEARRKLIMRKVHGLLGALWGASSHPRRPSILSYPMRTLTRRTTPTRGRSIRPLGARPWGTTATCTAAPTSCFWQMSLRRSGRRVSTSSVWTRLTTTRPQASAGTPYSRRQEWGSSCSKTTNSTCSSGRHFNGLKAPCQSQQSSGRGLRSRKAW